MHLPIDVRVPGASFREHYEVGDALVLLGVGPEMFRFEPRGLVRVPLAAPPRYFGSGNDRLILRVGDAIVVLDADGNATSWPVTGDYNVLALDDAWWLFVPNTNAEERFVEMHLPDGRPRAKLRRRFARTEGWMAPPRRFAEGWLFSNLSDDDDKTQSLTLFDAELATAAYGDGETPDDRMVTPVDDVSFWATAGASLERWERRGETLACTERFPSRASLWLNGTLVSVETWGLVTARDAAGAVRWKYDAKTRGASYLTETPAGVLLYDDVCATVLDLDDGSVRTSFPIESASVFVGRRGTVYLLSLGELWTLREEARSMRVGLGAELETTCGDDVLLRRKDGTCVLVGPRGVRGKFAAKSASFSVIGTRGGPWVVEGDRIRGAFAANRFLEEVPE
jgi:hypothetical protein